MKQSTKFDDIIEKLSAKKIDIKKLFGDEKEQFMNFL